MTLIMHKSYGYSGPGIAKYFLNRSLRIYPIYWSSVAFSVALILLLGENFTSSYHQAIYLPRTSVEVFKNLALIFPSGDGPRLTPPAWALTVELFFYLLIGIGVSKTKVVTLIWLASSLAYHAIASTLELGWHYRYYTIAAASLPFSTGALIYHYKSELQQYVERLSGNIQAAAPLVLLFAILANWLCGYLADQSEGFFFYTNFFLCAVMIPFLMERKELPFINRKLDKWLGDLSYPIYLFHYQVGMVVMVAFTALGISIRQPSLLMMLVSAPLILIVSWVVSSAIEHPIEMVRARVKQMVPGNAPAIIRRT